VAGGELGLMLIAEPLSGRCPRATELALVRRIPFELREAAGNPSERLGHASDKSVFRNHVAHLGRTSAEFVEASIAPQTTPQMVRFPFHKQESW
jgi:hypothetical protein